MPAATSRAEAPLAAPMRTAARTRAQTTGGTIEDFMFSAAASPLVGDADTR
jgi:hypothetical protein